MRRQHHVIQRQKIRIEVWLPLKDINARPTQSVLAQRRDQRCIIDYPATRDIDQMRCRFHQPQLGRTNIVVHRRRVWQQQDNKIGFAQECFLIGPCRLMLRFYCRWQARTVVINRLHAKPRSAACECLAYTPHANDA